MVLLIDMMQKWLLVIKVSVFNVFYVSQVSEFVKILVFSIFNENHLPDRDLNFFI